MAIAIAVIVEKRVIAESFTPVLPGHRSRIFAAGLDAACVFAAMQQWKIGDRRWQFL
jgi:hypothetical protein